MAAAATRGPLNPEDLSRIVSEPHQTSETANVDQEDLSLGGLRPKDRSLPLDFAFRLAGPMVGSTQYSVPPRSRRD